MNMGRTPLLLERRGQTRNATHKALDRVRFLLDRHKKKHALPASFSLITREMDSPPTMPSIGMTMASPMGPVSVGGIMRHS
jgi:hypothetical protein